MPEMSLALQLVQKIAAHEAQALGHLRLEPEHIFIGLCKIEEVPAAGPEAANGIPPGDWERLRAEIEAFREQLSANGLDAKQLRRRLRGILQQSTLDKGVFTGEAGERCRSCLAAAEEMARRAGAREIGLPRMLAAVLSQESASLSQLLAELGLQREALLRALTGGDQAAGEARSPEEPGDVLADLQGLLGSSAGEGSPPAGHSGGPAGLAKTKTPFLDKFGRDLTALARADRLDPTIGRVEEIKRLAQILVQKKKNNPILVGDPGVGKTCIVEGLARKIASPEAASQIRDFRLVEVSMGALLSGTKYRGEFEERLETMIREAAADPRIVLFIDEIHTLVGAGAGGNDSMDAANILKPALARGDIKCIGATTTSEYRKYIEKDAALERRFQLVWVDEPSGDEAIQILQGLRPGFESYHQLRIPDAVLTKAVEFAQRYLPDFRLPDKAIDLIDQACARRVLSTMTMAAGTQGETQPELTVNDVARVVSERCRVPVANLTREEGERLLEMEEYLGRRVIGQEEAVRQVAETIRAAKAGLKDPRKPLGVFLFLGPTGTGKTELAKALSEFLFHDENRLLSLDMSEYQEKHSVARLIGSPPGYIGHDEEGQLTGKIRTNPYSVVLLDEIEKAHPEVFDLCLQIFDEGRLTDSHGRKASFAEAVLILTSNLGSRAEAGSKRPIGIGMAADGTEPGPDDERARKRRSFAAQAEGAAAAALRPELLNRIQKRVVFYPLERWAVEAVIDKILRSYNQRLEGQALRVELSPEARAHLLDQGYSEAYGAREMQRTFDRLLVEPLSQMILRGEVSSGQTIKVGFTGGRIEMAVE